MTRMQWGNDAPWKVGNQSKGRAIADKRGSYANLAFDSLQSLEGRH